jgi:hypothetical protein
MPSQHNPHFLFVLCNKLPGFSFQFCHTKANSAKNIPKPLYKKNLKLEFSVYLNPKCGGSGKIKLN